MHFTSLVVALVVCATASACSDDPEQLEVAAALDRTITSLEGGDMKALWEITAPVAQKEVLKLHTEVHEALALVDSVYPPELRDGARKALGQAVIGDIPKDDKDAGPKILERILDPKAVRLDEKARDGLRSRGATIDGKKAVIHTSADEKFTFEKTDDGWRSGLVMDLIDQNRRFDTLRENARKVLEARDAHREAWVTSQDPKTPQGGYNVLRKTLRNKPVKSEVLFSLLDEKTRAVPLEALKASRALQKAIQRRSKKAARRGLYKKYGIDKHVKVTTDRGLFALWVKNSKFVPPLTDAEDKPDKVEGQETGGAVTVVTKKGVKVAMARGKDGIWRISSYEPVLRQHMMKPLTDAQTQLTAPKDKAAPKKKGG